MVFNSAMNRSKQKYQTLTSFLLLCIYLVGNLSLLLFEGTHFLLHLGDETPLHSFHTHTDTQHKHHLLTNLGELVADNSTPNIPAKKSTDNQYKKTVQEANDITRLSFTLSIRTVANFPTALVPSSSPFLPVFAPPPEV